MPLRATLLALAATLLLAAPAAARPHCAPRTGERVAAHGATLAALLRTDDEGEYGSTDRLFSCVRRTGERTYLGTAESGDFDGEWISSVRVAGWRMAWIVQGSDHYGNQWQTVHAGDVRLHVAPEARLGLGHFSSWDLGPRGEIAWIAEGHVWLWHPAPGKEGEHRILDTGVALRAVRIAGGAVRWQHAGAPASAPLAAPLGGCAAGVLGTAEVAISAERTAICWRATGLVTPLPPGRGLDLDVAGPYVAVATRTAVLRYDARDGSATSVPADGAVNPLVDAAGALAWTIPRADAAGELWAGDAGGVRQVGTTRGQALRDGSTIWTSATDAYTLLSGA